MNKRGDAEGAAKFQDYKTRLHNALSERIPAEGGFLVPEVLRCEILMVALETAIVRPRARVIPMDSLRVPLPVDRRHQPRQQRVRRGAGLLDGGRRGA